MSNQYFQFKQFTVHQERCAMKVSTDACIQGAWTPVAENVRSVLDIGAGTGLLSLMLAQRHPHLTVDAIELDEQAAAQASKNVSGSPWPERIKVLEGDVRTYPFNTKYDMVICNPPFFNNSLLGGNAERNNARHTVSLSYKDLLNVLANVLTEEGYTSILLPYGEHREWEQLLDRNGWQIHRQLLVQPREDSPANRVISLCSRSAPDGLMGERLVIYSGHNDYTPEAAKLLSPFYLKL